MTCHDVQSLLPFRRTGDLLPEDAALLDRHVSSCPDCQQRLSAATAAYAVLTRAFQGVVVPEGLQARVRSTVAATQSRLTRQRWLARLSAFAAIAVTGLLIWGYVAARPKFDAEGLAIVNGWTADPSKVPNLVFSWLESERLPTDLPYEFNFRYYVSHGYEKLGKAEIYVPVIKFQDQSTAPRTTFVKLYFLRPGDADASGATEGHSSDCHARPIPGPNGLTYVLVYTGADPAPIAIPRTRSIN